MGVEELAAVRTGRLGPFARAAAVLKAMPEFLERLPIGVYACDRQGRLVWFNTRATELWGRKPRLGDDAEKYCGSHKLYCDGLEVTREETPTAGVLRTGKAVHGAAVRIERPGGSAVWTNMHIEPVEDEDGVLIGAIGCFQEAVASTQAPDAADRQHLAASLEHAVIGLAEVDAEGRLLRVNSHLAGLLGRRSDELLDRSIFDPALAEGITDDQAQFHRQVRGDIDRYTTEKRFLRPDGSKLWVSVTSSSVRDGDGRFLYAVRVHYDVTGWKRAEEALARRADEQAALYEFTAALQHTVTRHDACAEGLTAILRALRCDRAAVLLYDAADVMRFEAWHGLSENYRRTVEGHSPWDRDAKDPEPICIDDVETADLPQALKDTVRAEGVGALAFIPILAEGRLLGKFMTYYDRPHAYARSEVDLGLTIARQLGFVIERVRAGRAAQHLAAIVESSHDAIISKDLNGIIQTWNDGAESVFGYKAEEVVGQSITIVIPPDRLDEEPQILARIRRGERVDRSKPSVGARTAT